MAMLFRRSLLAQLLAAALLLAACGEGKDPARPATAVESSAAAEEGSRPRRGGTAVVATASDLGGVNELTTPGTMTTDFIHRQLFLYLFKEMPDFAEHPPTFAPELAASSEWSPDHKVLTINLRKDVVWSDGVPVTAEDVRFTWQAQVHPAVAWEEAYFKQHIEDVEVVDPHTVRVHFDSAYATQLLDVNEGFILPKHAWEKLPFAEWRQNADFFRKNLVSSGPFLLEAWRPQQEVVLRRNPRFYRPGLPRLDRVVFRVVPLVANQMTQILSGTADFLTQVPASDVERVKKSSRARLIPFWGRRYVFVLWNAARPLFADAEVRRALTLAIDRETIVETLWGDLARVSVSPIVSSVWASDRSLKPWPYDPEQAKRILEAKGWRDGDGDGVRERGGKRFSFELMSNLGNAERQQAALMIQEQLRKVGVEAKPRILEFNSMVEHLDAHRFDASMMAYGMPTTLDLEYAFHTRSIKEGSNYGGYSNPEVDRLIDEARRQPDLAAARPMLNRMQQILHREQPFTFLWESQEITAASNRLQDVRPNTLSQVFNLEEWWLKPGS